MTQETLTTSWIWPTDDGVNGLRVNKDHGTLHWYDAIGCACDTSLADQSVDDYLAKGVPVGIVQPPADVQAEIGELLENL